MTYPGYLALGLNDELSSPPTQSVEIVNNDRAYTYANSVGLPWLTECEECPDMASLATNGEGYSHPAADPAPWYDPAYPQSADFLGVIGIDLVGADSSTRSANVTAALTGGGVIGHTYEGPRTMILRALAIGHDDCGLAYGIRWLNEQWLTPAHDPCSGDPLTFLECCPGFCDDDIPVGPCWPDTYGEMANGPDGCVPDWWPSTYQDLMVGPPYLVAGTGGDWCDWVGVYRELRTWLPPWGCCVEVVLIPQIKVFHMARVTSGPNVLRSPAMSVGAMAELEFTIVAGQPRAEQHPQYWSKSFSGRVYTPPKPMWFGSPATISFAYSTGAWSVPQAWPFSTGTIRFVGGISTWSLPPEWTRSAGTATVAGTSGVWTRGQPWTASAGTVVVTATSGTWEAPDCAAVLTEPFNSWAAWTSTGTIVAGRTGTAGMITTGQTATYSIASPSEYLTFGFAYKVDNLGAQANVLEILGDSGATSHNRLIVQTTGAVTFVQQPSTSLANSAAGVVVVNTWCYIEIQTHLSDSGSYKVRVNGVEVISGSGDTRNGGTVAAYDRVKFVDAQGFSSVINLYDDLYLSTGVDCLFQGDHTIS